MRINKAGLVAILALHNASNFEWDADLEVGLILELRDDGAKRYSRELKLSSRSCLPLLGSNAQRCSR